MNYEQWTMNCFAKTNPIQTQTKPTCPAKPPAKQDLSRRSPRQSQLESKPLPLPENTLRHCNSRARPYNYIACWLVLKNKQIRIPTYAGTNLFGSNISESFVGPCWSLSRTTIWGINKILKISVNSVFSVAKIKRQNNGKE